MADWTLVAQLDDIDPEEPFIVTVDEAVIALYHVEGEVFATGGMCPHEDQCLEGGYVEEGLVECPWHSATFDIKTGRSDGSLTEDTLPVFPVQVDGQNISINLAGATK